MKRIFLVLTIVVLFPGFILAQGLSPSREKEISAAINKMETANKNYEAELYVPRRGPEAKEVTPGITENLKQADEAILKIGKDAVPSLEKVFRDKSKNMLTRHKAMELAARLRDEKMTEAFLSVAKDKSDEWFNRNAALTYLAKLLHELKKDNKTIDKKYMKDLQELFEDKSNHDRIRDGAQGIYAQIGQNDALSVLIKNLNGTDRILSGYALNDIAAIRTPEAEEILFQEYLKERGTNEEAPFVYLLGRRKISKAVPYLIESLKNIKGDTDEASLKRKKHITALGEIGDKSAIPLLQEIANKPFINPGRIFNPLSDAEDAAEALVKLGDYETIKIVIRRSEIEGRIGKGNEERLRKVYRDATGQEYDY